VLGVAELAAIWHWHQLEFVVSDLGYRLNYLNGLWCTLARGQGDDRAECGHLELVILRHPERVARNAIF